MLITQTISHGQDPLQLILIKVLRPVDVHSRKNLIEERTTDAARTAAGENSNFLYVLTYGERDTMNNAIPALADFFTQGHRDCDETWVEVENAIEANDASVIQSNWGLFNRMLRHHLKIEEEVMFPKLEAETGMTAGPTMVMRMEHDQMRGLLDQMAISQANGDFQDMLNLGDTLLMLIQQHNQKEEGMLYPLAQQALHSYWPQLKDQIDATQNVEV